MTDIDNLVQYPMHMGFPEVVADVGALTGHETKVLLDATSIGVERLPEHVGIRALWCCSVDDARLSAIVRCIGLECLCLDSVRGVDLAPLGELVNLRTLVVDGATKIDSLEWIAKLPQLDVLTLHHFPRVRSLEPIAEQQRLRALDISGSMWTRMKYASLSPLADLDNVRVLSLTNSVSEDGSLSPLAKMKSLTRLQLAGFYQWGEYATLTGLRPDIECSWFTPIHELGDWLRCESCGATKVMLTGKGQPMLCPSCQVDRVRRHVERFEGLKRQVSRSS